MKGKKKKNEKKKGRKKKKKEKEKTRKESRERKEKKEERKKEKKERKKRRKKDGGYLLKYMIGTAVMTEWDSRMSCSMEKSGHLCPTGFKTLDTI